MKLARAQALNLVLGVTAIGTAAVVFSTRDRPTTEEVEAREANLLPVFRREQLTRIAIEGAAPFALARGAGSEDWSLEGAPPEPADAATVDRLLGGLELATPVRRATDTDSEKLGLTQPELAITLEMGSLRYRVLLGKPSPTPPGSFYAGVEDATGKLSAYVVSKETAALLRTARDDFRRRDLVGVGQHGIAKLSFERAGEKLELVAGPVGFRVAGAERASRDALEPVFAALARLEARRFIALADAERARAGAAALVLRVTPREQKERERVIELGGACPGAPGEMLAITRAPRAFAACVPEELLSPLTVDRALLRDANPFLSRADEVERLAIERGDRRLTLERRGTAFLLRAPTEAQVELDAGNERLAAILRAPAELVPSPDLAALGLSPASGRVVVVTLTHDEKAVEESVELGKTAADGTLYLKRTADGAVLALGRDAARAYAVDGTLLRSRKVLDFALSAVTELELSSPERQLLRRDGEFRLLTPPGFTHDGGLLTDALLALGSLTATRWVADADDGSFGLGSPRLTARVSFKSDDAGASEAKLSVGRSTPGGYFASIAQSPGVFVLERATAEKLSLLLIDRSAFMLDPKALGSASLRASGKSLDFERRGETLVPKASTGLEPSLGAEVLEVLESLRPEAALHTGPALPEEGFGNPALEIELRPAIVTENARTIRVGAAATRDDLAVRYVRVSGVDATFVIATSKLKPLFALF